MRFELLPLLEAAAARTRRPKTVVSVRDILQENRKPERDLETVATLERYFDHVLVHADPHLVRFEATFPHYDRIRDKVLYTGIVAPEPEEIQSADGPQFDVIVSVGGGALGRELLFAAAGSKQLSTLRDASWCIVTGINTAEEDVCRVRSLVSHDVVVTPFLPNLGSAIARAKISVSRAGYNTLADIYRAGCRAVVVPLSNGEETEQIRRAEYLAEAGLAVTVDAEHQTPEEVAAAIDRAMAAPAPDRSRIDLDGAPRTAEIVAKILSGGDLSGYR
jgi:predicted glycosyltransferase